MIYVVTRENRRLFRHTLMDMHRQRKAVFVDRMGWPLDAPDGLEIDAYDCDDTTYLIDADHPSAPVRASVRLLPSDRPHLMSEVFAHLCADGVPRSPAIWEASRFCPAPETSKGEARRLLLGLMIAGIMETALLFGVERVTFVAGAALAPLARSVGWRTSELGPPQRYGRERIVALAAEIDPLGLRCVRTRHGLAGPLIRYLSGDIRSAA